MLETIAIAVLAVVGALFYGRFSGKVTERERQKNEADAAYIETRRRIDDASESIDADPAVIRDWLRERGDK